MNRDKKTDAERRKGSERRRVRERGRERANEEGGRDRKWRGGRKRDDRVKDGCVKGKESRMNNERESEGDQKVYKRDHSKGEREREGGKE